MILCRTFGIGAGLLMASILFSMTAAANTLEETETWILKQAKGNRNELKYLIQDGQLIRRLTLGSLMGEETIDSAIPIDQVKRITYKHTRDYISYSLMCDEPCAYLVNEPNPKQSKFLFEIHAALDLSFPPRMNAALLHLVNLYGGKASIHEEKVAAQPF